MLRGKSILAGVILAIGMSSQPVMAAGPAGSATALQQSNQSLIVKARQMTEYQKCKALNRCRQKYTHCYNKLERAHRVADKDKVCVPPYQKCINANFGGFDWFFTRWFNPAYLDCRQYR